MRRVRLTICLIVVCVMAVANFASAETIRGINNMDFVSIGNAGNATDSATGSLYGAVGYDYRIGKYEITNAQWNAFTAAGAPTGNDGYYPGDAYDQSARFTSAQQPTNNVSWYEVAQFCNWLTSGDKSKGAYQFSGNNTNPGSFLGIDRVSSTSTYGTTYVIPTEDEWYKAAYFKPDGSGYSRFANGTSTPPSTSQACYGTNPYAVPWNVGSGAQEQNGTFDMMGNVWEWNETLIPVSHRGMRGGAFYTVGGDIGYFESSFSGPLRTPYYEYDNVGFRIASVPEPATLALLGLGGLVLRRSRK